MFGTDGDRCTSRCWFLGETVLGSGLAAASFAAAAAASGTVGAAAVGAAASIGAISLIAWGVLAYLFELGSRQFGLGSHSIQAIQLLGAGLSVGLGGFAAISLGLFTSNALLLALAVVVAAAMVVAMGYCVATGNCGCPLSNCCELFSDGKTKQVNALTEH